MSEGLTAAIRSLRAARRKPDDSDRPPPSTLPGPKPKILPGQLTFDDGADAARR